jgi:PE-PPE domain
VVNAWVGATTLHDYSDVDPNDPDHVTYTEGNVTYVYVRTPRGELPLVAWLKPFAPDLANDLDDQWRPIIEEAYDRPGDVDEQLNRDQGGPEVRQAEVKDPVAETKVDNEQAKTTKAEKRAEKKAQRAERRAEKKAQREAKKAERAEKRAAKKAARQAARQARAGGRGGADL